MESLADPCMKFSRALLAAAIGRPVSASYNAAKVIPLRKLLGAFDKPVPLDSNVIWSGLSHQMPKGSQFVSRATKSG